MEGIDLRATLRDDHPDPTKGPSDEVRRSGEAALRFMARKKGVGLGPITCRVLTDKDEDPWPGWAFEATTK
jgi:hypothetical protein